MRPQSVGDISLDAVLLGARESLSGTDAATMASLLDHADLARVERHALQHKVFPLLASSLANPRFDEIPGVTQLRTQLQLYTAVAAIRRASKLAPVAASLANLLKEAAIPYIFLRGMHFARRYYSDPGLRVSEDIDILVPVPQARQAMELLTTQGCEFHIANPALREAYAECMGQLEMKHLATGTWIDVNWMLTGNCGIGQILTDMDGVWQRARHLQAHEYALCPEDELLELIRHTGHGHDFQQALIKTCADVNALLAREPVDWQLFEHLAAQVECLEIARAFAWFYGHHYALSTTPGLWDPMTPTSTPARRRKQRLFCRLVMIPSLKLVSPPPRVGLNYARETLSWICKLSSLDNTRRMRILLAQVLLWPPRVAVLCLTHPLEKSPLFARRLLIWAKCLSLLPGIAAGMAARLAGSLWR